MRKPIHPARRLELPLLSGAFFLFGILIVTSREESGDSVGWFLTWTPSELLFTLVFFSLSLVFLTVHLVAVVLLKHEQWRRSQG